MDLLIKIFLPNKYVKNNTSEETNIIESELISDSENSDLSISSFLSGGKGKKKSKKKMKKKKKKKENESESEDEEQEDEEQEDEEEPVEKRTKKEKKFVARFWELDELIDELVEELEDGTPVDELKEDIEFAIDEINTISKNDKFIDLMEDEAEYFTKKAKKLKDLFWEKIDENKDAVMDIIKKKSKKRSFFRIKYLKLKDYM